GQLRLALHRPGRRRHLRRPARRADARETRQLGAGLRHGDHARHRHGDPGHRGAQAVAAPLSQPHESGIESNASTYGKVQVKLGAATSSGRNQATLLDVTTPQLQAPDIGRWRNGGTGVDWVHVFDSHQPGPRVMVQALTHGNEICGAIALDWLLDQRFRPQRGSLTLAFANVAAFARFDPADPFSSRLVDEDYNRVWSDAALFGPGDTVELRRARQLLPYVDAAER